MSARSLCSRPTKRQSRCRATTWAYKRLECSSAHRGFGAGTVVVYTMFDNPEAAQGGFPQGTIGVAMDETRSPTIATGEQLAVANATFTPQPVMALVFSYAPSANPVNFAFAGTSEWSAATKTAVQSWIDSLFLQYGAPVTTGIRDLDYPVRSLQVWAERIRNASLWCRVSLCVAG
ncbi:baseplate J/gp47 family protein [Paraburkholderia sediminicola]|uniref:baseplate J/gp47 family protein n=1 Tax=Paraburkholderia sediminicola TaxID=458836 RepID=UPI0038BCB94C